MNQPAVRLVGRTAPAADTIFEGDTVEISVTAVVKIGREENWIKFGATSKVRPGETGRDAHSRTLNFVQESFQNTVEKVVVQIQGMGD